MKKSYIYAGISILFWATIPAVTKLCLASLSSIQVLAASSVFAFLFLLVLNLGKGNLKILKTYRIKDFLAMAGVGLLGIFIYHLFLYTGIDMLMASQAMVINYLWPIMTVLAACVILKEKLTKRKILAIFLSFIGVTIVTTNGQLGGLTNRTALGVMLCVLAAVAYGLFVVLNKRLHYDKFLSMMLYYLVASVASLGYLWIAGEGIAMDIPQTLGMAWIGVFTCAIAFITWALAMDGGDTAKISNLAYITPFLSLGWTYLLVGEPISISCLLGLVVIIAGVLIQLKDGTAK